MWPTRSLHSPCQWHCNCTCFSARSGIYAGRLTSISTRACHLRDLYTKVCIVSPILYHNQGSSRGNSATMRLTLNVSLLSTLLAVASASANPLLAPRQGTCVDTVGGECILNEVGNPAAECCSGLVCVARLHSFSVSFCYDRGAGG